MESNKLFRSPRVGVTVLAWLAVGGYGGAFAADDDDFHRQEQLTPASLIKAVLARNPDVPAMQAAWEAARARIEQAHSLDDPMLAYAIAPRTAEAEGLDLGQKISISQRLPWPGKRELRSDVARFESDAAYEDIAQVRLDLTDAAHIAFADWYFVYAAIRVNAINRSLLQESRDLAQVKYATGRASKQDVMRAEVEVALLEHRDIVLERGRRAALATLNTLLQRPPDAPVPPPASLPKHDEIPSVIELRAATQQGHPTILALDARLQALQRQVALAERAFYPDFQLSASHNSLWMRDEQRFTVGLGINIPLASKRRAAKDEAQAELMRLDYQRRSMVAQLLGEVQQAYDRLTESRHVVALYRDRLLPLAEENLAAARSDYEAGQGSFLDVIGAERNLMQARLQLEEARADRYRRFAALERATGGGQSLPGNESGGVAP